MAYAFAYAFQDVDDAERPVAFMRVQLAATRRNLLNGHPGASGSCGCSFGCQIAFNRDDAPPRKKSLNVHWNLT
jgi:hypothetical protein